MGAAALDERRGSARGAPAATAPASVPRQDAGELYAWGVSPFAYKVLMAAAHKGVAVASRVASLRDCARAQEKTGKRKTPFLVDGDAWITDSSAICAHLEQRFAGPSLLPAGERERAECLLIEDWADEGLNRAAEPWIWTGRDRFSRMHRLVWQEQTHLPSRIAFRAAAPYMRRLWRKRALAHGGDGAARALLCAQLDLLERRLAGRPWLFGDAPTVADFAVAGQLANLVRLDASEDLDARPAASAMVRRAASVLPWAEGGAP